MSRLAALARLAARSAWNRRLTLSFIALSIALSTILLVGLERIRGQARAGLVQAISGVDLVVGARGSQIQLVLYSVFHLGSAPNNLGWDTAKEISALPEVEWAIPISLGDSHRGYPVVATTGEFFDRYRYLRDSSLTVREGEAFRDVFEVVLGAEVARKLRYKLGGKVVLRHGTSAASPEHSDKPFVITGILAPTGSPVDRSLFISLESMEAIHVDWRGGAPIPGLRIDAETARRLDLEPKAITAILLRLKNRRQVFGIQRLINDRPGEALTAAMPGVALDQLWRFLASGERALLAVSALVTMTGLMGLIAAVLAGLGERRRELAVLRSVGARPLDVLILVALESAALTLAGVILGLAALAAVIAIASPLIRDVYGLLITLSLPTGAELLLIAAVTLAGFLAGLIPAIWAYRLSLSDGLTVRV